MRRSVQTEADPGFWFGRATGTAGGLGDRSPAAGFRGIPVAVWRRSHQKPEECYVKRLKKHLRREKKKSIEADII